MKISIFAKIEQSKIDLSRTTAGGSRRKARAEVESARRRRQQVRGGQADPGRPPGPLPDDFFLNWNTKRER